MLTRADITPGTYLRQRSKNYALKGLPSRVGPVDYVGMVCEVTTTEETGGVASSMRSGWFFRVRYLHQPRMKIHAGEYWSERLTEEDLVHFEPITLQQVKEWFGRNAKKTPRLPDWAQERQSQKPECDQLPLFDHDD